jgi:hypothetical protein
MTPAPTIASSKTDFIEFHPGIPLRNRTVSIKFESFFESAGDGVILVPSELTLAMRLKSPAASEDQVSNSDIKCLLSRPPDRISINPQQ